MAASSGGLIFKERLKFETFGIRKMRVVAAKEERGKLRP